MRRVWGQLSTGLALAGVLVGAPSASRAGTGDETTLVLGVSRDSKFDQALTRSLSERLRHNGETVLENASLSPGDRACFAAECFEKVAIQEGAKLLFTTTLKQNGPNNYYITSVLYDATRHIPHQQTSTCDCMPDALAVRVSDMADKLFRDYRQHAAQPTPPPMPPENDPAGTGNPSTVGNGGSGQNSTVKANTGFSLSPRRKVVAGVLGGIAGALLITSIALHATDKSLTSLPCGEARCRLDNMPLYATGYALTGTLAIGIGLTLFWPSSSSSTGASEKK